MYNTIHFITLARQLRISYRKGEFI